MGAEHDVDTEDRDTPKFTQRDLDRMMAARLKEDRAKRSQEGPDTDALERRITELEGALGQASRREEIDRTIADVNPHLPGVYRDRIHRDLGAVDDPNPEVIGDAVGRAHDQWQADADAAKPRHVAIGSPGHPRAEPRGDYLDSEAEAQEIADGLVSTDPTEARRAERKAKTKGWF